MNAMKLHRIIQWISERMNRFVYGYKYNSTTLLFICENFR